ncbi:MAG: glucosaminidase domain-containing protein, partial [Prevotella sp.]|nr:glucosaminidase domain-containing protein [Prevotella sp.]
MKRNLFFLVFILSFLSVGAQTRWNAQYQEYVDQWSSVAIEQMNRYRIPASITLAQGLLESGAGRSELAREGNNHFGIKCHNGWTGPTVYKDDDQRNDCFRSYKTARESYEDHSRFLVNGRRYQSLFSLKMTDYKGWARGLKAAGYATNPKYADRLIEIIEV